MFAVKLKIIISILLLELLILTAMVKRLRSEKIKDHSEHWACGL